MVSVPKFQVSLHIASTEYTMMSQCSNFEAHWKIGECCITAWLLLSFSPFIFLLSVSSLLLKGWTGIVPLQVTVASLLSPCFFLCQRVCMYANQINKLINTPITATMGLLTALQSATSASIVSSACRDIVQLSSVGYLLWGVYVTQCRLDNRCQNNGRDMSIMRTDMAAISWNEQMRFHYEKGWLDLA